LQGEGEQELFLFPSSFARRRGARAFLVPLSFARRGARGEVLRSLHATSVIKKINL
jgi:hypothetical protein